MRISDEELNEILRRNPRLRVSGSPPQQVREPAKPAAAEKPKPSAKYRNHKVYVCADGFASTDKAAVQKHGKVVAVYDSQKEHRRHEELKLLERSGEIRDLVWQYPIEIMEGFVYEGKRVLPIVYKADFFYFPKGSDNPTVEDVKGFDAKTRKFVTTADFRLKWKLLKHKFPDYHFVIFGG